MREHRDDVSLPRKVDGGLDRLDVALTPPDRKAAAGADDPAQGPPVELRLRHEPEEVARPERHAERPWVEAREVVTGEDEPALRRDVLDPAIGEAVKAS